MARLKMLEGDKCKPLGGQGAQILEPLEDSDIQASNLMQHVVQFIA